MVDHDEVNQAEVWDVCDSQFYVSGISKEIPLSANAVDPGQYTCLLTLYTLQYHEKI